MGKICRYKKRMDKKNLLLLIDESHEFKNSKALKTKAIRSIKYSFDYRILMSATPAINHIEDFYSQLELIDKSLIPMSENAFKLWLANRIGTKWDRYAITSYNSKNVKKLKDVIQPVAIQRLKEDIPEMKVEKIIKEIYLQMTIDQSTLYNLIVKEEIKKIKEEYNRLSWQLILDKLPLMCEILDNPLLLKKRRYNNEKINYILDKWDIKKDPKFILLESLLSNYVDYQGEKVVVYGIHPDTLNILTELFKKYNPLVIHGSLDIKNKEKDRALKQQMFNERDENKVMFLSALTSSQGINLQKKCRRIIVYEMTWDTTKFRQLQDRTHRIDSTQNTIVEIPYYPKTIDIVRVKRNLNRIDFNNRLTKEISQTELINLIEGIV